MSPLPPSSMLVVFMVWGPRASASGLCGVIAVKRALNTPIRPDGRLAPLVQPLSDSGAGAAGRPTKAHSAGAFAPAARFRWRRSDSCCRGGASVRLGARCRGRRCRSAQSACGERSRSLYRPARRPPLINPTPAIRLTNPQALYAGSTGFKTSFSVSRPSPPEACARPGSAPVLRFQ
jgi:hypothetical protein